MTKEEKLELAKTFYDNLGLTNYSLDIFRDDEINSDFVYIPNMRASAGLIIDDAGDYLFCQSSHGYEYWKEEFKKGVRSNKTRKAENPTKKRRGLSKGARILTCFGLILIIIFLVYVALEPVISVEWTGREKTVEATVTNIYKLSGTNGKYKIEYEYYVDSQLYNNSDTMSSYPQWAPGDTLIVYYNPHAPSWAQLYRIDKGPLFASILPFLAGLVIVISGKKED